MQVLEFSSTLNLVALNVSFFKYFLLVQKRIYIINKNALSSVKSRLLGDEF